MKQMNQEAFRQHIAGKRVAIIGLGVSNRPLIKWLASFSAQITVADNRSGDDPIWSTLGDEWKQLGLNIITHKGGTHLDFLQKESYDYVFRSPSLRPDHRSLLAAKAKGAVITTEIGLLMALCPCHVTAVTGSDGKTTTTTLIAKLYEAAGKRVWLGGNIGKPLLADVFSMKTEDEVVLELSSFQLFDLSVSPNVAVVTNITPNHLDVHRDFDEYKDAKLNIFKHQNCFGKTVLDATDKTTLQNLEAVQSHITWFKGRQAGFECWFCQDGQILFADLEGKTMPIISLDEIQTVGEHNIFNYLAALAAVGKEIAQIGIKQVASTFFGVEHRLEPILISNGVTYINSSIDSSPTRTVASLKALANRAEGKIVLIAGGKDKNSEYDELGKVIGTTCQHLILCGANQELIASAVRKSNKQLNMTHVDNYEQAVLFAKKIAKSGDVVVLSPAGTSFDRFANFEVRGKCFKECVTRLCQ